MGPGLEYEVELDQPPNLFVIRKQLRRPPTDPSGPSSTTPLAYYYVLDKVVDRGEGWGLCFVTMCWIT